MKHTFIIFFLLLLFNTVEAKIFTITCQDQNNKEFYTYLEYLNDPSASLSIKNTNTLFNSTFYTTQEKNAHLGLSFQNPVLWSKIEIKNSCPTQQERILSFKKITFKDIQFFKRDHDQLHTIEAISLINNANFKLQVRPQEVNEYYIRFVGDGPYIMTPRLIQSDEAIMGAYKSAWFFSFFATFVLTAIILYLLIFIFLREVMYLYFSLHIASHLLLWLSVYGVFTLIELQLVKVISIFISSVFITLLSFDFLETQRRMPKLSKSILLFLFLMNSYYIFGFYFNIVEFIAPIFGLISSITYLLIIVSIIKSIQKESKKAIYLLLALGGYILGYYITIVGVFTLGKVPVTDFSLSAGIIGVIIDIFFVSLAFIYMAKKTYKEQRNLLVDYSKSLEQKVQERTLQIKEQNSLLHKQAITDALTQLPNRLELDRQAKIFFENQTHSDYELFAIIIDIDNFKMVNDKHGHLFGDTVLKTISSILNKSLKVHDIVGRWGGEEFLAFVYVKNRENILKISERIRANVYNHTFDDGFTVTISLGLSSAKDKSSITEWIQSADEALYKAKENGKNQVILSD